MSPSAQKKRIAYFDKTPIAAALASKLVEDRRSSVLTTQNGVAAPHANALSELTEGTSQSIRDAENIFSTQPDTEIAMAVLVSAIVSPNDLREPNLTWAAESDKLPSPLSNALLEEIRKYFEEEYRIQDLLVPMLEDCLFKTGSYPLAVLPESAIDDLINSRTVGQNSLESYVSANFDSSLVHIGGSYLGPNNKEKKTGQTSAFALENLLKPQKQQQHTFSSGIGTIENLYITDSIDALKLPELTAKMAKQKIGQSPARQKSLESFSRNLGIDAKMAADNLQIKRNYSTKRHQRINPMNKTSRASIGHPLTMKFPSEAVIPVHVPSDPGNPLGHFVLLDINGHPVSADTNEQALSNLNTMASTGNTDSRMLERNSVLQSGLNLSGERSNSKIVNQLTRAFTTEFERDVMERFANGIYGQEVQFPRATEFYRLMLARSFSNMHTQVLFIPAELMTYFAFDYNKQGIGQSLLDKMKVLANLRSVLLFANVMGSIKNSVPRRELTINLEETDPEPEKSIEIILTEYARVQSGGLPLESTNPKDIISGLRKAATGVSVTGNSKFPEVGVEVQDVTSNRAMVDTDLMDNVTKQYYQGFCLTPDLVDSTSDIEFAQVALNSHLLFTKRISLFQGILSPLLSDHVVKYTMNDGELLASLLKIIVEYMKEEQKKEEKKEVDEPAAASTVIEPLDTNVSYAVADKDEFLGINGSTAEKAHEVGLGEAQRAVSDVDLRMIETFLESITITLPAPDNTKLANQIEQFEKYADALDSVLPVYLSEDILTSIVGDNDAENIPAVIEIVKGYFLRDYLARNNIMPELNKLITNMGTEDNPFDLLEEHTQHVDGIAQTLSNLINKLKEKNGDVGDGDSSDYGYDTNDSGGDFDTSDDDLADGGDDQYALDIGNFEDEEPEEQPEEEKPDEEPEAEDAAPTEGTEPEEKEEDIPAPSPEDDPTAPV